MMKKNLLPPLVEKNKILKADYNTVVPGYLHDHIYSFDHIWLIKVTPQKSPESGAFRAKVTAAANNLTGDLVISAIGREPVIAPPSDQDDLRPMSYYAWNKGTQTFSVFNTKDYSSYTEIAVTFD